MVPAVCPDSYPDSNARVENPSGFVSSTTVSVVGPLASLLTKARAEESGANDTID